MKENFIQLRNVSCVINFASPASTFYTIHFVFHVCDTRKGMHVEDTKYYKSACQSDLRV